MKGRILCVDDESNVLDGLQRRLRRQFELETTTDAVAALERIRQGESFAVVLSDMRMPQMDGATFLSQVRQLAPDTVRIMLTGCSELSVAVEAVNDGNVFRFLTKPCVPEVMVRALEDALRQHELLRSERVLLEQTLRGAIKVLCEVMATANPFAFGCASRIRGLVRSIAAELCLESAWRCELAAMLAPIGTIAVPQAVLDRAYRGIPLAHADRKALDQAPALGQALLSHIPRLESVAQIVGQQNDESPEAPVEVRLLRLAIEFDRLRQQGLDDVAAVTHLRTRPQPCDPKLLAALESVLRVEDHFEPRAVMAADLQCQMLLARDVCTRDGTLLVPRGQEVTLGLRQRLVNFAAGGQLEGPIHVLVRIPRPKAGHAERAPAPAIAVPVVPAGAG